MRFLSKSYWSRALHDPIIAAGLVVDLIPVFGLLFFGWGAAALVMLYWLENLVIGAFTIGRILLAAITTSGVGGLVLGGLLSSFFAVHYGMFCMGHGFFLLSFLPGDSQPPMGIGPEPLLEMVAQVFERWPMMSNLLIIIACWQAFVFATDDLKYAKEHSGEMNPIKEMFAPYGRIVVLHIGVFAGASAILMLGDPMIGVLALILFRAVIGVIVNQVRRGRIHTPLKSHLS